MKKIYNLSFVPLCLLFITSGCYNDKVELLYPNNNINDTTTVSFSAFVQPILQSQCVSCHSASNPSGSVDLSVYNAVKTSADNGKLVSSIKQDGTASAMPQGAAKLDATVINKIDKWVKDGAVNN